MSDFTALVDDFKDSINNPLIKDAVKRPFDDLQAEQSIAFNGPKAHEKFRARIHTLIDTCNDIEVFQAYRNILIKYQLVMSYMNKHI
jgi:hypothetical protein